MPIATMLLHLSGISPQARYVLMKLWLDNRDSLPMGITVQECAQTMAVPRARAGKVLNELIEAGHLETKCMPGHKGRPKRVFDISTKMKSVLHALTPPQPHDELHLASIHALLSHRTHELHTETPALSPSNLVFLIALLSYANECGSVHNLGMAKLRAYTGMTTQRVNLQVSKMRKLRLILATIPGTTGGRVLGKTTTAYWLNLSRPPFKSPIPSTIIKKGVVTLKSGDIASELFELTRQLRTIRAERRKESGKQLQNKKILELAERRPIANPIRHLNDIDIFLVEDFFKGTQNAALRNALQVVIDRAAIALTLARISPSPHQGKISLTPSMIKCLYRELLPVRLLKAEPNGFPTKKNQQMLVRLVLQVASITASEIVDGLRDIGFKSSSVASLELAPTPNNFPRDRYLVAAIRSPGPQSSEHNTTHYSQC